MILDALRATLLDLVRQLDSKGIPLILGGGYGLYLKQEYLAGTDTRTLIPRDIWAPSRSTEDLDVFLRTEIVADPDQMQEIKSALSDLHFVVREQAKYTSFEKRDDDGYLVRVDLLTGPFGEETRTKLHIKGHRVRPNDLSGLHATHTEDAIGLEDNLVEIPIGESGSNRENPGATIFLPHPFTYLVMKLHAFADRLTDDKKNFARHHTGDIFRIVAMLTEDEYELAKSLSADYRDTDPMEAARKVVREHFAGRQSLGVIRLREHGAGIPSLLEQVDSGFSTGGDTLDEFLSVLHELFG